MCYILIEKKNVKCNCCKSKVLKHIQSVNNVCCVVVKCFKVVFLNVGPQAHKWALGFLKWGSSRKNPRWRLKKRSCRLKEEKVLATKK